MSVSSPETYSEERFRQLEELQTSVQQTLAGTVDSLTPFYVPGSGGFGRTLDPRVEARPSKPSGASSATCVAFLRATDQLAERDAPWAGEFGVLVRRFIDGKWDSGRVGVNNPFAIAFLLEALGDLGAVCNFSAAQRPVIANKLDLLVRTVKRSGRVGITGFPPNSFLTYKAVCALGKWDRLDEVRDRVAQANWRNLHEESLLVASHDIDADVFEVIYSVLIASRAAPLGQMTPQQRSLLRFGMDQFFAAQREDGGWPRSRPLFAYRKQGYAYCHDHELLAALLSDRQLRTLTFPWLAKLEKAAGALEARKYPLDLSAEPRYGWASGHHGRHHIAESWATAAALHFCFALDRVVAELIRREVFDYTRVAYFPPLDRVDEPKLPDDFLDSELMTAEGPVSLKAELLGKFIRPLVEAREGVQKGRKLNRDLAISAIFYGPPGTSKTEIANLIAKALGWPLLCLDPSHVTRRGLDNVHAEAGVLFGMLERCEEVVVLLDEFDELVRERDEAGELQSRFLTTAMLPKLIALGKQRKLVYLIATNHLERFDAAIRRPGRFEVIAPIWPPTADEKTDHWPALRGAIEDIERHGEAAGKQARADLGDLIFLEAEKLAERIGSPRPPVPKMIEVFHEARAKGTLAQRFAPNDKNDERTWKKAIEALHVRDRGLTD